MHTGAHQNSMKTQLITRIKRLKPLLGYTAPKEREGVSIKYLNNRSYNTGQS